MSERWTECRTPVVRRQDRGRLTCIETSPAPERFIPRTLEVMKKLLILVVLVALAALAVKKVQTV
jgi:hypothetical protein